jgi:hypothetical protein
MDSEFSRAAFGAGLAMLACGSLALRVPFSYNMIVKAI